MSSDWDSWLELAARFSIVASVLIIMYIFLYTAWRIARVPNNPWPWNAVRAPQEIHQTPTQMPFTLKLREDSINDLDQITFHLSCQERVSNIRLLWAVDASYLFKLINAPSWDVLLEIEDSHLSEGGASESNSTENGENGSNKPLLYVDTLHIRLTEDGRFDDNVTIVTPKDLNWRSLSDQYKYPLAIFIKKAVDLPTSSAIQSTPSIVGLCVILHVKNTLIPKPTTILAQYIKLSNGQAHMLQSLYVMDGEGEGEKSVNDLNEYPEECNQPFGDVLCSVCQCLPVSRAIIPCRHVCLCAHCFGKVQNCPICRGPISCFFKTRNEEYLNSEPVEDASRTRPIGEVLTNWNDTVNNALGFRD